MGDLFVISRANIFAIYPKILENILICEDLKRKKEGSLKKDYVNLPTDTDYQERVYYRLLAVQKAINDLLDSGVSLEAIEAKRNRVLWDPSSQFAISPLSSPTSGFSLKRKRCVIDDPTTFLNLDELTSWSLYDLVKAGKLLRKPALICNFCDEHEMRRVYSMIYDVFRYKHVLSQALHDVQFFHRYPKLKDDENRVWLVLYDLHLRHFMKRDSKERLREKELYHESDLQVLHDGIWDNRIQLAASISRIRIKNSALHISELLPSHLQDEKVAIAAANPIVTGWINPFKLKSKDDARESLIENGFLESTESDEGQVPLRLNHFKWDKVCPLFLSCIPSDRSQFAKSCLMMEHQFIMQDRAFTLGPAIFSRLLEYFEVEGDVVQTHLSSPRSTAYLAALFQCNYRVNDIIIYGAGSRLNEYKDYMKKLGINNIRIFSEQFCRISIESQVLEKVVGIFVTPPNSYSAVSDPIDLICSRGGDLSMLEVLTESEMSESGKQRVADILEEQRESLRLAMSRPQVQFILYETHSMVGSENEMMVNFAVDSINQASHARHIKMYKEKKRLDALAELDNQNAEQLEKLQGILPDKRRQQQQLQVKQEELKRPGGGGGAATESDYSSDESSESETEILQMSRSQFHTADEYRNIRIPKTDIFETIEVPDVCQYQNRCLNLRSAGCFLSLIKRRVVLTLDEKHLILMAERRGLFGDTNPKKEKLRMPTRTAKKDEKSSSQPKSKRRKSEELSLLIDRLSQPTHSSLTRSQISRMSSADNKFLLFYPNQCEYSYLHHKRQEELALLTDWYDSSYMASVHFAPARAKQWWTETVRFLTCLHLKYKLNKTKRSIEIFEDIKNRKILPLHLSRNDLDEIKPLPAAIKPSTKTNRRVYPLATGCIEFDMQSRNETKKKSSCLQSKMFSPKVLEKIQNENSSFA